MTTPLPGSAVRGSKTGKPIMALFDLLGRTWALGVLWHLSHQTATYSELQKYCENISPTLLSTRLKELSAAMLIEKTLSGYRLTDLGQELFRLISPMGEWSLTWQKSLIKQGIIDDTSK